LQEDNTPPNENKKDKTMKEVNLYTDGACKGNPGPGGYAAIVVYGIHEKVISEGFAETTNNRMELSAVIAGLSALKERCIVNLYSDSKYVIDGLSKGWAKKWKANGWVKSDKQKALNPELWDKLLMLTEQHEMRYIWVKGHDGHEYNERCDRLAVEAAERFLG